MIVDCHSHICARSRSHQAEAFSCLGQTSVNPATSEQHRNMMAPADVSLLLGFVSDLLTIEIPNSYIKEYLDSHPGRTLGFAGVDPRRGDGATQIEQLQAQGFVGLTLSPACQGFHPCDSAAMSIYEVAAELPLPIYFLQGEKLPPDARLEFSQPVLLDEVARTFPGLKIVLSHMGYPWREQTVALLAKHPHVYADVAGLADKPWQAYRTLILAAEFGVIDKLLLASDFPAHTVKAAIEAIYSINKITLDSVLPPVPRELLRGIVERDSLKLLGLEHHLTRQP